MFAHSSITEYDPTLHSPDSFFTKPLHKFCLKLAVLMSHFWLFLALIAISERQSWL